MKKNGKLDKNEYIFSTYMTRRRLTEELQEIVELGSPLRGYWNTNASMYMNGDISANEYNARMEHIKTASLNIWN